MAFSFLLWMAATAIFAFSSSFENSQSTLMAFSELHNETSFYNPSSASHHQKKAEVVETLFEEVEENISSNHKTFPNNTLLSLLTSVNSEALEHQTKVSIALRDHLSCFFTYKSLFIKFCTFRI